MIDIVGHFGTTFSYATVASRVARALREAQLLGSVSNLDPEWHADFADLKSRPMKRSSNIFLVAAPHHYMDAYPQQYGRERSAIFMSPNTDRLSKEHSATCAEFGWAVCPSAWCEQSVLNGDPSALTTVLPLGADPRLLERRLERAARIQRWATHSHHTVHFSTDQWWPGRKGTEELLEAWARAREVTQMHRLTIHVPPALMVDANYRVRDLGIHESVSVVVGQIKGTGDILSMFDDADLVIAPSRCEGFGIMLLSSLVAGVPLLCTYPTGQQGYLDALGGWIGIPTATADEMPGEDGLAPSVVPHALAQSLIVALGGATVQMSLASTDEASDVEKWTWDAVMPQWVDRMQVWLEETNG